MEKGSDDGDAKRRTRVRRRSSAMRDVSPTIDCTFDRQINQQLVAGGGLVLTLRVGAGDELVQLGDVRGAGA